MVDVQLRPNPAFNSLVVHLAVRYSHDALGNPPPGLLLKRAAKGWGEREVAFYRWLTDAGGRAESPWLPMVVPCYDAAYDPATGGSHLLLRDLSATHAELVSRDALIAGAGVPAWDRLEGVVAALAGFHGYWWEHPTLAGDEPFDVRPWYRDETFFTRHVARREREWAAFDAEVGAELPAPTRRLYQRALRNLENLWDSHLAHRVSTCRSLTLSHGDCYLTQWMSPRTAEGQPYLVDFDSVSANFGAYDLIYLLTTFWTRSQRHEFEGPCLHRYHRVLLDTGVVDHSWEDLLTDYRLMLALMVFDPVFDQTNGSRRAYWWPKMQCLTAAFQDWDCASLFG